MHIMGHGVDIVELDRVVRLFEKGDDFLDGWFTEQEQREIESRGRPPEGIAGRVAAKEACVKALGTGFSGDVSWHDVEVRSPGGCTPQIVLSGGALAAAERMGITAWFLSISHTARAAIASVIAVGAGA